MSNRPSEPPDSYSPPGARPMTAFAATGWALGITYLFILIVSVLVTIRRSSAEDMVSAFACQVIAYLAGLFLILRVHAPDTGIRDFLGVRPTHPLFYLIGVLLGASLNFPANALEAAIERWSHHSIDDDLTPIFHASSPPRQALMALVIILFGPTLEEVLFRGALFRPMLKVHPAPMVIVVTATLFAISHPAYQSYLPLALPLALLGGALGILRRASGSLVPAVLLHGTFNALSFYPMAAHHELSVPGWLVIASAVVALALLGGAHLLGERANSAILAQEYDRQ